MAAQTRSRSRPASPANAAGGASKSAQLRRAPAKRDPHLGKPDRELLRTLSNAAAVSGDEGAVRKLVLEAIRPHVDEVKVDALGNVLAVKLLTAEGESMAGPILEIGNTNSRYRFSIGARKFVNDWNVHGPAHHYAVGVGHVANKIEKLGQLLGLESARVC